GLGIKRVISSNLVRAKQTAQYISHGLGDIPMTTDWRLNALDLGIFAKMKEADNADRLGLYFKDPDVTIPGSSESVNQYMKRTDDAVNEHIMTNQETGPILILGHSSTIATYLQGV